MKQAVGKTRSRENSNKKGNGKNLEAQLVKCLLPKQKDPSPTPRIHSICLTLKNSVLGRHKQEDLWDTGQSGQLS